jgi:hypothetical protein
MPAFRLTLSKCLLGTALASVAVLAVTGYSFATTGPAPKSETIKVVSRATAINNLVDIGPTGPSPGDVYVYSDQLFKDATSTQALGRVDGSCHVIDANGLRMLCTNVASLPGGQLIITGSGSLLPGKTAIGGITGGTGRFDQARGWAKVFLGTDKHDVTFYVTFGR